MWLTPRTFIFSIHQFLNGVADPLERRLLLLAAVGESGAHAHVLIEDFKKLGIIHVLILSGSQVRFFTESIRRLSLAIIPRNFSELGKRILVSSVIAGGLMLFGWGTAWAPSLTRAIYMEFVLLAWPRLRWEAHFLTVLAVQLCLYPEHARAPGFYFSWLACLALRLASLLKLSYASRISLVTFFSQILAVVLIGQAWPSVGGWALVIAANLAIGGIFEKAIMPLLGWVMAFALMTCVLGASGRGFLGNSGDALLILSLQGMAGLVLVAVKAFMYIGVA